MLLRGPRFLPAGEIASLCQPFCLIYNSSAGGRANKLTNAKTNIIHRFELSLQYNEISLLFISPAALSFFFLSLSLFSLFRFFSSFTFLLLFVCFSRDVIAAARWDLLTIRLLKQSSVGISPFWYIDSCTRWGYRCFSKCSSRFRWRRLIGRCTCWPEAEIRCGNDESHKWHDTKSNDAHINAGCVRSRDDTCR